MEPPPPAPPPLVLDDDDDDAVARIGLPLLVGPAEEEGGLEENAAAQSVDLPRR